MMSGFGFGFMGLWMVLGTLLVVALIVIAIWAITRMFQRDGFSEHDAAVELLRRRFAAGEITAAEYEQALKTLG